MVLALHAVDGDVGCVDRCNSGAGRRLGRAKPLRASLLLRSQTGWKALVSLSLGTAAGGM